MSFDDVRGRRRVGAVAMVLLALACSLAAAPAASAELFLVDSVSDTEGDAALGDEFCLTAGGKCTLRAAIEEGNELEEFTRIDFDDEVFEGEAADTIELVSGLPPIEVQAFVNGRDCSTEAGRARPCVGIDGPSGGTALTFDHASIEVVGLAMTGAGTAIHVAASPTAKVRGNWFGVALDGAIDGNGTGVVVGAGSNRSFVGGEGAKHGNVFAGSANDALDVHGGNEVKVFGNYFGVEPDGVTLAPNGGDDVEVVSTGGSGPTSTEIGTRVNGAAAASPLCDGGCNVISGAVANAIDLQGDGGLETAATSTSVLANYIGLDSVGASAIPNAGIGIRVGEAVGTAVGGPSAAEANRINGGSAAIVAGPAATDLSVRGNLIGTDATGTAIFTPPNQGIAVDSAELPSPSAEAVIAGNRIGMEDGVAIFHRGQGAWILDNEILGSQVGIQTAESTNSYGNVIEGNRVEGAAANGILVENDLNEIVGNEILGAGAAGIRVDGSSLPFGVSGNRIGGDTAADENAIDGSGGAAIQIANIELTDNEVARNRGAGNGGLFIDLIAASPATEDGPNRGIQPPTFSTATQTGASGGAEVGATVRVFRKQSSAAGELGPFLGQAVADDAGGWALVYDGAIPAGTIVAATQSKEGRTSELAMATTPGSQEDAGEGSAPVASGILPSGSPLSTGALFRPQTKIVGARARRRTARFVFRSDGQRSKFLCRLDGKPFDLCRSPKRYVSLEPGRHVFWVRAIDPAGRVDLSPARKKFVIR